MQTAQAEVSLYVQVAICLIALLPLWYFARQYAKDARDRREGRGDERYAWLRRNHPDHPALPPAPPKPMIRTLVGPWRWRFLWVYAAQLVAVAMLTWVMLGRAEPVPPVPSPGQVVAAPVIAVIIVAFSTALMTRLWDLSRAALARRSSSTRQRQ